MTTSNEHNNAPAVPQGWKLVPVEPTRAMWAAVNKLDDEMAAGSYDGKGCSIEQAWNCMLDFAPDAPALAATPAPAPAQGEPFGHFRAEPFGWTDCAKDDEGAIALYEHPMANPWRDAVLEQLESWHIYVPAIHDNSPRLAIKALVNIECKAALDPAVSSEAAALVAQGVQALAPAQEVGLTNRQFDLICQAIDKADTATMEGDYMLDSDGCINVVRVMQALFDVTKPAQEVPSDPNGWCQYVAGMVFCWLQMQTELPPESRCVAAIAGIIERRLWAYKPEQERCSTCGYLTSEREHLGCLRRAVKDLDIATGGPYDAQEVVMPTDGQKQAVQVMQWLDSGEWELVRSQPLSFLTDEANAESAWLVRRQAAPYCDKSGTRQWAAKTAFGAFTQAIAALRAKGGK